jgi:hypothetical protein
MKEHTLARELSQLIGAWHNCNAKVNGNPNASEWIYKHSARIGKLIRDLMPSGSGWDCGTKLDFEHSYAEKLVFFGSFHHMNDSGMYDGWTDHTVTATPSFTGLNLRISGRNRNDIKEYLHELFYTALSADISSIIERERAEARTARKIPEYYRVERAKQWGNFVKYGCQNPTLGNHAATAFKAWTQTQK